jgi:hypothetical protein
MFLVLFAHTSSALNFQYALLASVALKCADQRGSHCEDCPLTICRRACLGVGWRRSIDDVLVAPGDVWAVAGCVERGHGEVRAGELVWAVGERRWWVGRKKEREMKNNCCSKLPLYAQYV